MLTTCSNPCVARTASVMWTAKWAARRRLPNSSHAHVCSPLPRLMLHAHRIPSNPTHTHLQVPPCKPCRVPAGQAVNAFLSALCPPTLQALRNYTGSLYQLPIRARFNATVHQQPIPRGQLRILLAEWPERVSATRVHGPPFGCLHWSVRHRAHHTKHLTVRK